MSYLYYLYHNKNGKISDMEAVFGKNSTKQMIAMGFISTTPSLNGDDSWHITLRAKKLAKLRYRKSTVWERICDWIYLKIFKINFN